MKMNWDFFISIIILLNKYYNIINIYINKKINNYYYNYYKSKAYLLIIYQWN